MIELIQDLKHAAKGLKVGKLYSKLKKKEVWNTQTNLVMLNFVCDTLFSPSLFVSFVFG